MEGPLQLCGDRVHGRYAALAVLCLAAPVRRGHLLGHNLAAVGGKAAAAVVDNQYSAAHFPYPSRFGHVPSMLSCLSMCACVHPANPPTLAPLHNFSIVDGSRETHTLTWV